MLSSECIFEQENKIHLWCPKEEEEEEKEEANEEKSVHDEHLRMYFPCENHSCEYSLYRLIIGFFHVIRTRNKREKNEQFNPHIVRHKRKKSKVEMELNGGKEQKNRQVIVFLQKREDREWLKRDIEEQRDQLGKGMKKWDICFKYSSIQV